MIRRNYRHFSNHIPALYRNSKKSIMQLFHLQMSRMAMMVRVVKDSDVLVNIDLGTRIEGMRME